ncbi:MAG: DUF1294 domain-containing protein [Clostridia bacterium]|nr:DUF1294 domain-containing protein [Clostridia bacterium]
MTLTVYTIYLAVLSLTAFILYAVDKWKAKRGAWRIPEATLLGLSFLGGAIGGYLAMQTVRHKTRKWYFHFVNIIGIIWQAALLGYLFGSPNLLF